MLVLLIFLSQSHPRLTSNKRILQSMFLTWTILQQSLTNSAALIKKPLINKNSKSSSSTQPRHAKQTFVNYQLWEIVPVDDRQFSFLNAIPDNFGCEFWKEPININETVHILVSPATQPRLLAALAAGRMTRAVLIENLQAEIDGETRNKTARTRLRALSASEDFDISIYHVYDEILEYINSLAVDYPSFVEVIHLGKSFEENDLKVVKIGKPQEFRKPGIWIDAGFHAREWISISTALYIIHYLTISYYNEEPDVRKLLNNVDFYILPVVNPDGYMYSRTTNRLWRKNRSGPYPCKCNGGSGKGGVIFLNNYNANPSGECFGVDLNRNWPFSWDQRAGSSSSPCADDYKGPEPWSEPESRQIGEWLQDNAHKLKAYVSLHSYSQVILYSYGHRRRTYGIDGREVKSMARDMTDAIRNVYQKGFRHGSCADLMYVASGTSMDWARAAGRIMYSYTFELRSKSGFILPEREIVPTGEETWAGIRVLAHRIYDTADYYYDEP